ncbi:MAG: amino acid ABC transporter substrate-binding protein [Firmicutes bacterium]|jgi:polar amino acid transport system substrate-binding protein|nr:amino acid ABC transporter substrate-binding protein [Bacillota bacterium]
MKLRRLTVALLLLALVVTSVLASGCSQPQPQQPEPAGEDPAQKAQAPADDSWERVKAAGKLVAGLDDAFAPFGFRDDKNNIVGFDIDLGNKMAERLGIKMEWQPAQWSGIVMSLKTKKFDVIWSGMSITPERAAEVNFTDPYIGAAQIIITKADNKDINSKEDLAGKVVGTQLGSTGEVAAKKVEGLKELKAFDIFPDAINDLNTGRLDAVVIDDITARYYLQEKPGAFRILDDILSYEPMGIAVRKEDTSLLETINNEIKAMIADGTYAEISEKWFGEDMSKNL